MNLIQYIKDRQINNRKAASELGISDINISRYCKNVIPGRKAMEKIITWSHGAVTPNDFYNMSAHCTTDKTASQEKKDGSK